MNAKYILACGLLLIAASKEVSAQANIQTLAPSPIWASEGSFLNPALLKNTSGFHLNVGPFMGLNLRVTNNFLAAGGVLDFARDYDDDNINFGPVRDMIDNLRDRNELSFHSDFTLFHANFGIGKPKNQFRMGLSVRQHAHASVTVNDEFINMLYKGNKQYAGQTVYFEPEVSTIAYTDFGVALSKTFTKGALSITPAVRLRYLIGEFAAHSKSSRLGFYTAEDGSYISLSGKVEGDAGGVINFEKLIEGEELDDMDYDNISNALGRGFALDLGATVTYKNITLSIAAVDNGAIRFNKDAGWHFQSQNTHINWEGYNFVAGPNGMEESSEWDPVEDLDIQTSNKEFRTRLGSKLTFNGNYGIKSRLDKRGHSYFKHNVGLSIVQGFSNRYNAASSPWTTLYYQYNWTNRVSAGVNVNQFRNIVDLGANVGFKLGVLQLGLGTNSLMGAINPYRSRQADFFFTLGFRF